MFRTVVVATLAAAALALSGCGEADAPESTPAPAAPSVPAAPAPAPPAEPAPAESESESEVISETTESEVSNLETLCSDLDWRAAVGASGDAQCGTMEQAPRYDDIPTEPQPDDGVITGPGAVDPDVYGDGPSSGEKQRAWLEEQGLMP